MYIQISSGGEIFVLLQKVVGEIQALRAAEEQPAGDWLVFSRVFCRVQQTVALTGAATGIPDIHLHEEAQGIVLT